MSLAFICEADAPIQLWVSKQNNQPSENTGIWESVFICLALLMMLSHGCQRIQVIHATCLLMLAYKVNKFVWNSYITFVSFAASSVLCIDAHPFPKTLTFQTFELKENNLSDTNSRCMFPLSFYLKKNYLQILDIKRYDCDNILSPFWSSRGLVIYQLRKAYLDFDGWGAWTFLQIW